MEEGNDLLPAEADSFSGQGFKGSRIQVKIILKPFYNSTP